MSVWHKITPYLTDAASAISAVAANHPYPARDLLITLVILIAVAWALLKIAKSISK